MYYLIPLKQQVCKVNGNVVTKFSIRKRWTNLGLELEGYHKAFRD